jgi:hypothetical protein
LWQLGGISSQLSLCQNQVYFFCKTLTTTFLLADLHCTALQLKRKAEAEAKKCNGGEGEKARQSIQ